MVCTAHGRNLVEVGGCTFGRLEMGQVLLAHHQGVEGLAQLRVFQCDEKRILRHGIADGQRETADVDITIDEHRVVAVGPVGAYGEGVLQRGCAAVCIAYGILGVNETVHGTVDRRARYACNKQEHQCQ